MKMNLFKKSYIALAIVFVALSSFAQFASSSAPVVPGEYTDPTNLRRAIKDEMPFETPRDFQFPYFSLYYLKPVVTTEDKVEVDYYVTDWDHSLERMRDRSHRFNIHFKCVTGDGREYSRVKKNVGAGDGKFTFKPFKKGEYNICLWAVDIAKGLESHRVWQRFRVLEPKDLVIPEDKIYKVTNEDLKKYEIRNDDNLATRVLVEVASAPKGTPFNEVFRLAKEAVVKYANEHPPKKRDGVCGYTIYIPAQEGRIIYNSFRAFHIVYDEGYDTNKVEQAALKTSEGLQKLLDDKAAAGFRKLVLLPGQYRISPKKPIYLPSNMTFDLNGATIKENGFTGRSSQMIVLRNVDNTHLINGTLEGDYYEHDYSPKENPEWPFGFVISGESRYCSVENVHVKDITGYGGCNGHGRKNDRLHAFLAHPGKYSEGALNPKDGSMDASRKNFYTSRFIEMDSAMKSQDDPRLQISKFLGYQGVSSRQWTLTLCWYDKDKKFITSETLHQYRLVPIPKAAKFLRFTQFNSSLEEANKSQLSVSRQYTPYNCVVKNCVFDRCRCVGYAASAMQNFLFESNLFTRTGESAARSAFDAEDGWDMMMDTTFRRNVCRDNPGSNSLLCCAGHNFIFEENESAIHFYPRTYSVCVRNNNILTGDYSCDGRTRSGYARFSGNRYRKSLTVPHSDRRERGGWDFAFNDFDVGAPATNDNFTVRLSDSARLVNSRFVKRNIMASKAIGCSFRDCAMFNFSKGHWSGNELEGCKLSYFRSDNVFDNCSFKGGEISGFLSGTQTFRNCTFEKVYFGGANGSSVIFENCKFKRGVFKGGYWTKATNLSFKNCTFEVEGDLFFRFGAYSVGNVTFDSCRMIAEKKKGVIFFDIADWRPSAAGDAVPGKVTVRNCKVSKGFDYIVGCGTIEERGQLYNGKKPTKKIAYEMKTNVFEARGGKDLGPMPK